MAITHSWSSEWALISMKLDWFQLYVLRKLLMYAYHGLFILWHCGGEARVACVCTLVFDWWLSTLVVLWVSQCYSGGGSPPEWCVCTCAFWSKWHLLRTDSPPSLQPGPEAATTTTGVPTHYSPPPREALGRILAACGCLPVRPAKPGYVDWIDCPRRPLLLDLCMRIPREYTTSSH